ncbi:hypothetical protein O0L34_g5661 [Tuta absoluta]|nr:hypothetical protein O0L34_g5661 [Tuta absoluta]
MNELLGWYGYERLELRRWAASRARDASSPEPNAEQKSKDECSWCNKRTREGGAIQHAGSTFCSELCFSQSRRANFKRAKTCDWCRHVRHTVAYVDFQDGATQLQFCSDKCLNQYKMHVFCRETQAHLDLNPHLVSGASTSNLITPELWLNNCKSRSASPERNSEKSASPETQTSKQTEKTETQKPQRKSPVPLITVAPTAKLMKPKSAEEKPPKEKKDLRHAKMNLRKRRTSKCSSTVTSQTVRQALTPKAQDLRLCSPSDASSPASTAGNSAIHSPPHPPIPPPFPNQMFMPPPMYMENGHELRPPNMPMPNMFPPRHFLPRTMISHDRPRLPLPLNFPHAMGQAPPVTVLVPYPVIIPIPLPIPIPIPFNAFLQAHCLNKVKTEAKTDDAEGPLDFTMNSDKNKDEKSNCENTPPVVEERHDFTEENEIHKRLEDDRSETEATETGNPEQTLPKFKITRLGNKMAKIVAKPREQSESNRPLRKRRRLVEVDAEDDSLIPKTRKIVEV